MKANELRIGNLVTITRSFNTSKKQIKVKEINLHYLNQISKWNTNGYINPIQLTDEWLLKFGFVEEFENKFYKNSIAIEIFENECIVYLSDFVDLAIRYVHQLQNLYFALTGEELAIA